MTMINPYCTLASFKAFAIPEASTDATDDTEIEAIIEAVSRVIDDQTCRYFYKNSSAETRYFTAESAEYIEVGDLVSVTALYTDDGLRTYPWTWATTDYDLWPDNNVLDGRPYQRIYVSPIGNYGFPIGSRKGVKISGVFGWSAVPDSIELACKIAARSVYNSRHGENEASAATVTAAGVVITPKDFPAECWTLINPYRRRR